VKFDLVLCDANEDLCHAFRTTFRHRRVSVESGDFFDVAADAYVSPANSRGIMDGGFDLLLRIRFPGVDVRVQREIDRRGGLLPVGHAIMVETLDPDVPYLVSAPTMVVPSNIQGTNNVYLAMLASLRAVHAFNEENDGAIETLAVPGLGTGVGKVQPHSAEAQMWEAPQEYLSDLE